MANQNIQVYTLNYVVTRQSLCLRQSLGKVFLSDLLKYLAISYGSFSQNLRGKKNFFKVSFLLF